MRSTEHETASGDRNERFELGYRRILTIAVPIMISNLSTPLLGLVDTGVVGQLPDPAFIGAVAIGSLIFTFTFWAFGFLRMGTTGLTAQALGAGDHTEIRANLGRPLLLALALGGLLILLQDLIRSGALLFLEASPQVESLAGEYFQIRIWSAPAALANYAILGWFVGLGRTRIALVIQLVLNLTNIALDFAFVTGLGWDVKGVALGTSIAEGIAALLGLAIAARHLRSFQPAPDSLKRVLDPGRLRHNLLVNGDIMIRSLALLAVFIWFTAQGARSGDVILAANSILMQFVALSAYFLDGIAFATESLIGRAVGAKLAGLVRLTAKQTTRLAAGIAVLIVALFALGGSLAIGILTVDPEVRAAAHGYLLWAVFAPLAGVWCFQLDGIFIGATRTVDMRNAMLLSLLIFAGAYWALQPFGNHGLWGSLYAHYAARTLTLLAFYPGLVQSIRAKMK
ncbi:MAG: MATE family efflux transporter [bacterium]|nr:MATE family efflux transporter [bacterium]